VHEDLPSPAAPDIVGFIDGIVRGRLCGWVYDRADPGHRLTVAVWDRTGRQVSALADRYRADVQQGGHGDGYYGFVVPLRELVDVAAVRVVSMQPEVELSHVSSVPGTDIADPQDLTAGSYVLRVDRLTKHGHISGWAVDTLRPQFRRALKLHADGRLVGQQRATLYRAEAVNGVCDGYHGFLFARPGDLTVPWTLEDVGMGSIFRIWP
jgi:hypothetical protein